MTTTPPLTASRSATTADRFKPGEMFWHFSPVDKVWYRYLVMPQSFSDERNASFMNPAVWTICTQTGAENPFVASNNVYADESESLALRFIEAVSRFNDLSSREPAPIRPGGFDINHVLIGPGKGSGVYGPEADFTKALGGATLVEQKEMRL